MRIFVACFLLTLFASPPSTAQHLTHDIGVHIGSTTLQSDYGVRGNILGSFGNSGATVSFTHTVHFFNKTTTWNADNPFWSYVALKTELNFFTEKKLAHYGPIVRKDSELGNQLRAMKGGVNMFRIGVQMEYYLKHLGYFMQSNSNMRFNPYAIGGIQYAFFNNTLESSLGDWREDITVLPEKWREEGALDVGTGRSLAISLGVGTRINLMKAIDLNAQFNMVYFLSDAIDGLQAKVPENKFNDFLFNLQVGIIYNLNFSSPLKLFK